MSLVIHPARIARRQPSPPPVAAADNPLAQAERMAPALGVVLSSVAVLLGLLAIALLG
jgi:hypothetical protein